MGTEFVRVGKRAPQKLPTAVRRDLQVHLGRRAKHLYRGIRHPLALAFDNAGNLFVVDYTAAATLIQIPTSSRNLVLVSVLYPVNGQK